jgi:oxygen-independent coproporphyrinogen-3 oxidase
MINTRQDHDYWDPARKGFITNYPNFPHWKRIEATQLEETQPFNIYLHTPFCIQRCSYCYYKTINLRGTEKYERMDRYVNALCREIELASQRYGLKRRPVLSIYFGGGTPSLLYEEQIERVGRALYDNFDMSQNPEFTMEAEPVTITKSKADTMLSLKVNRMSMGVQSFDDEIIQASHRLDSEKKALKAIDLVLQTGVPLNIDLMSGLAGDTQEKWQHSVQRTIETGVESVTVYKTELYSNTEYYRGVRNQTLELPSDEDEMASMRYSLRELINADYVPWSFFSYTKRGGHQHVHSPSIFRGDDCAAFGVSAFGRYGDWLYQNTNDEEKYIQMAEAGELPAQRGYPLPSLDNMIRDVVLCMKLVRFDLRWFQQKHGFKLESICATTLQQLQADGFIEMEENEIRLTEKGMVYGDYAGKSLARALMAFYN